MEKSDWIEHIATGPTQARIGQLQRIVESQDQVVTNKLVDSLEEQAVLEQMLEDSKPQVMWDLTHLSDYLLRSPWRYPPLKWGSRFGHQFMPSLFYGALDELALFSEGAYYRWVFLYGVSTPFEDKVMSQHMTFKASFQSKKCLDTTQLFEYGPLLCHPKQYGATQALGEAARELDYEALIYQSARCKETALNIALLTPKALVSRHHFGARHWLCETTSDRVTFKCDRELKQFYIDDFLVSGELPLPA